MANNKYDLPIHEIALKEVGMGDTIPGAFNVTNLNFIEISRLLNLIVGKVNEIASVSDLDVMVQNTISQIEMSKKEFHLAFSLSVGSVQQVQHFGMLYNINRLSDTQFVIDRVLGDATEDWDVSRVIAQLKNLNGEIVNAHITTNDSKVYVSFENLPETDHILYMI